MVIDKGHQKYMDKNKKVSIPEITINGQVLNPINYNSNTNVVTFSKGIQYDLRTGRILNNSSSSQSSSSSNSRRSQTTTQTTTQSKPKPTTRPKPTSSSKTSNIDIESALDNGSDEGGSAD